MKKDNKALNDLDQEFNLFNNDYKDLVGDGTGVSVINIDHKPVPFATDETFHVLKGAELDKREIFLELNEAKLKEMPNGEEIFADAIAKLAKDKEDYASEHSKFMHSQVPEVEPEDTDTIHPDYEGIPMLNVQLNEMHPDDADHLLNMYRQTGSMLVNSLPMDGIKLVVLGEPKAQKRHRHVNMGKFTRQYDPSANDKGDFLSVVQKQAPEKPIDVPVRLYINFYFTRPKSHYKTGKNAHILKESIPYWHTSKPDTDNCFKFVTDALNKVFWRDDSLICDVTVQKQYSDQPRIEITIQTL